MSDPESSTTAAAGRMRSVLQAELTLLRAREHLHTVEAQALRDGGADPAAYDAAIAVSREARAWATIVRAFWRCRKAGHGPADPADEVALR